MSMTFPNDTKLSLVQYFPEATCLCSITKVPFFSKLEVEYIPDKRLLEFIAFDQWLATLADKEYTIESLCEEVFNKLTDELGYINLSITVHATTQVHHPAVVSRARTVSEKVRKAVTQNMPKEK